MTKRARLNQASLRAWAEAYLVEREPEGFWPARGLWHHWRAYGDADQLGTPRSFANELRKLGFVSVRIGNAKRRYHAGVAIRPPAWRLVPDYARGAVMDLWWNRYYGGRNVT